jgi:peptide/nickel transport system permease protein
LKQYILRRLLHLIPTLLGITILVFLIITAAPGNPLSGLVDPNISAADIARRMEQLGLNNPWHVQYFTWLKETVSGNLGYSIRYKQPVSELIQVRLWPTFLLSFTSLLLSFLIAVPIGVLSATRQYSKTDYFFTIFAMTGLSIPVFFFGIAMIKLFAFDFRLFPIGGMMTAGLRHANWLEYARDVGKHLVLPLTVLSMAGIASYTRYTRSCMLEVIRQDYVRTARAKGLSERVVIYKHALRNALIPVITILGLSLPAVFSGAILTETVFVWPGMGLLNVEAVSTRDYPLLMGINLFLAILVLLGNLLADILYAVVDPRIRYD